MKVHLIRKETIEAYASGNARARSSFEEWLAKLKCADWEKPTDIQLTFGSADLLGKGSNRVVLDIGGNNYRLICKYAFGEKQANNPVSGYLGNKGSSSLPITAHAVI